MKRRWITALLLFESLAIAALHGLGTLPGFGIQPDDFLASATRVDDAVASSLRYITLGLAYWLLLSTLLYCAARLSRIPNALRAIQWATLPPIRRVVDRALAVSLTVGTLITPTQAMAQTPPPPVEQTYVPTPAGVGQTNEPLVVVDENVYIPPGASVPAPPLPTRRPNVPQPEVVTALPTHLLFDQPHAETHEVVSGENLWSIARDQLAQTAEGSPSDGEIAAYWIELIAANHPDLASGDPDLIYPGEVLVLPPPAP